MQDYRVELDAYSGPLDLLLFLVRRHEIDLHNIPIAKLTQQYLEHLEFIQQIDVELAGEFLVMAATLLEIKSALLLPRPPTDVDAPHATDAAGEQPDPRYELVQQLLAYKRFKDAAVALEDRRRLWAMRYPIQPTKPVYGETPDDLGNTSAPPIEIDLQDANVMDLCQAYTTVIESVGHHQAALHEVTYDDTPIALHAQDIVDRLERDGSMSLQAMFVGRKTRSETIGLFLATLELVRQNKIRLIQDTIQNEIQLSLRQDEPSAVDQAPPNWHDPDTGQIQYDWPSEKARRRAERRAKLRTSRDSTKGDPETAVGDSEPMSES